MCKIDKVLPKCQRMWFPANSATVELKLTYYRLILVDIEIMLPDELGC